MFPEKGLGLMEDWIAGGGKGQGVSCLEAEAKIKPTWLEKLWPEEGPRVLSCSPHASHPGLCHSSHSDPSDPSHTRLEMGLSSSEKTPRMMTERGHGEGTTLPSVKHATAHLYTWTQSGLSPGDGQTTHRSEPLVERRIQHQIYLHTLKIFLKILRHIFVIYFKFIVRLMYIHNKL